MIERILPATAAVVTTRGDLDAELFPAELAALGDAVDKRRREFTTVRACARVAYERLALPPAPVVPGPKGEPSWADGVVGSITHCAGYRGCAVARATDLLTIGIDAEPNAPLPDGLIADIALPQERSALAELAASSPTVNWDRLLFSAKESVYKAWFPLARRRLGFEDAVVAIDGRGGTFSARLLVPGPPAGDRPLTELSGRWITADDIVATAIALPAPPAL